MRKGQGKEICDLLVVFGDDILLFSDKYVAFPDTGDLERDWKRWFKRAVAESAMQLRGAERWIRAHPDRVFIDRACTIQLPVDLSSSPRFHRIVVAHGAAERCTAELGGSGSLMIFPDLIGSINALMDQLASRGKVIAGGQLVDAGGSVWRGIDAADLARAAQHTFEGLQSIGVNTPDAASSYFETLSAIHAAAAAIGVHLSDDGRYLTDEQVGNTTPANAFAGDLAPTPEPVIEKLETPAHPYLETDPAVQTYLADTAPSILHDLIDAGTSDVARLDAKPNARPKWNEQVAGDVADAEQLKTDLADRGKSLGITIVYDSKATLNAHDGGGARGYITPGTKVIHVDARRAGLPSPSRMDAPRVCK